jgi:hypothetical protein
MFRVHPVQLPAVKYRLREINSEKTYGDLQGIIYN